VAHQNSYDLSVSFWRFSPLPHTRICSRLFTRARETCQGLWRCPPHHILRKMATLFRQPRSQQCPGSYLSYFYIYIRFFLQTAGLQDGSSHCVKILSSMYTALNSDPSDPDVNINLDISNTFNTMCRQLTLDVRGGKESCDYACGLKEGDNIETVCGELCNMFEYFRMMRTTKSHLLYFDYCGNVLDAWGKTTRRTARRSPRDDRVLPQGPSPVRPDPQQAPPRRVLSDKCRQWLHQGKTVRRLRGALGRQACTQGGCWPRP
jgi:hypothetical protein